MLLYVKASPLVCPKSSNFSLFRPFAATLAIALALLLVSCGKEKEQAPVSEDQLLEVLIDVHIAEAAVQSLRGETKDSVIHAYYDQVFEIYGLKREDFETTMELYRNDPKRMEELYAKVMTEMERQEVKEEEE